MKILIFIQDVGLGGVLRQVSLLADGLARKGHEVSVLGLAERDRDWKYVWNSTIALPVLYTRPSSGAPGRAARLIRTALALRRRVKKEKVEVLYALQGDVVRYISWLATRGTGVPLVWGKRGSGNRTGPYWGGWKRSVVFRLSGWASGSVPLTISNSEAGARQKGRGSPDARHRVIRNGFDAERFRPDPAARARVRSEWKIGDHKLIGIAARLSLSKGHAVFLSAAKLLLARRDDARFVIVGDGPEKNRVERLGHELGLAEKLIWAGAREDMPAVYNALDILCSASAQGEGCPNVIGEAMAAGVPCVVTDVGDSAEIVGDLGIVVPPRDPRALAEGLEAMLGKLDGIDRRRVRERIVENFSIEAMVDKTERALAEVAAMG